MSVTINGTSGVTFNDASSQNTAATGFGFKNRIINGAMVIDQRNAGASVTADNGVFGVDRFNTLASVAGKLSAQRNAGSVTPPTGFTNYLGYTSTSAYSVGASEVFALAQNIEGFNIADLAWGTANAQAVTVSFWVRSSLTGTFSGFLANSNNARSYVFSYTISAANTWEQKTVTIPGDTTGTWLTDNGRGIRLFFTLAAGSSITATAGSWIAGDKYGVTGTTSVVGTNGATFYITGVQLEKGSTATSFDYRPYGTELQLCQRYYQQLNPSETQYLTAGRWSANAIGFSLPTVVSLRASPTAASSGNFSLVGNATQETFTSPSFGAWSTNMVTLAKTGLTLNPSATQAYVVNTPGGGTTYISFSSEL